jgi:hypothetical protein
LKSLSRMLRAYRDEGFDCIKEESGCNYLELKKLLNWKGKTNVKKSEGQLLRDNSEKQSKAGPRSTKTQKRENDLSEKLKAAFHEEPDEDPELRKRKELDETMRDFRKSFRQDVRTGVKQQVEGVVTEVRHQVDEVVTEVKHSIANIKDTGKMKKKSEEAESSDED